MNVFKTTASFIVFICLTVNPTFAYDKKDEEIVTKKIEKIKKGMENNDMRAIIETMPPKFFIMVSKRTGISVSDFKDLFEKHITREMQDSDLSTVIYNVDVKRVKTFKSETNREYVIFPTEISMQLEDKIVKSTGTLLAVNDDDTWYLMSLEKSANITLLNQIYPSIKKIEMFKNETQIIKK